ncbi:hypothetical protein [Burkholderia pyrrocinia]
MISYLHDADAKAVSSSPRRSNAAGFQDYAALKDQQKIGPINVIPGFRFPASGYLKMSGFKFGFAAFFPRFEHYAVSKVSA